MNKSELVRFSKNPDAKYGRRNACRQCYNRSMNTRKYNITTSEYQQMLEEQQFSCKICGKSQGDNGKALAIDHCHTSNKIRELLCSTCNKALGLFKDDPYILIKGAEYLLKHKQD